MGFLGLIFFYIGISMGWLYVRWDFPPSLRIAPSHRAPSTGIHGGRARLGGRADRDVHHLEQGEQVGLYRRRRRGLLRGRDRVARQVTSRTLPWGCVRLTS